MEKQKCKKSKKKEKKKRNHIQSEKQRKKTSEKELIKEPEPDIGLYPNERLPLQSNSKRKNINTIILFFFSLVISILMQLSVERSKKRETEEKN